MAPSSALAGSLGIHGALAVAIVVLVAHDPPERDGRHAGGVAIEVVNAPVAPVPTPGGAPPPPPTAAPRTPRQARTVAARAAGPPTFATETTVRIEDPSASGGEDASGEGAAGEGASGEGAAGRGGGHGGGIGLGDADGIASAADVAALPLPAPPIKRSLARPPRLIWPTRDGPLVESELYVARLTIDVDGLVDAVRLVRRSREPHDNQAENAVWGFRYSPALDDDGRPVRATIEQPFMLHLR